MTKKRWDLILNWNITLTCNFRCEYCNNKYTSRKTIGPWMTTKIGKLIVEKGWNFFINNTSVLKEKNNPDISHILSVINNISKTALIRLLGGEPFICKHFIELCSLLTQKHYIDIESNFTLNNVKKFADTIDPGKVNRIKTAFHIKEIEKKNMIRRFIDNILYCKTKGFNPYVFVVLYPEILKDVSKYRQLFAKEGIVLETSPFEGYYKGLEYPVSYTRQEIEEFNINLDNCNFLRKTKGEPCSAGTSFFTVFPSGRVRPCYKIYKNLGNIYTGFKRLDTLIKCPFDKCTCDPRVLDPLIFENTVNPDIESGR